MNKIVKRLGELLIERKLLTSQQLVEALDAQRITGELIGALLLRRGWVTEDQLLEVLSAQFSIPRVRLDLDHIDWSLAGQFSSALLSEHHCFPIHQDDLSITVAIADPLDAWAISAIETQTEGRQVRWVLATRRELEAVIRTHYDRTIQKISRSFEEKTP